MADSDITTLFDSQNPELWPEQDRVSFAADGRREVSIASFARD